MASLEESLLASAIEGLNIETYWPSFNSHDDLQTDDDSEYSIILCFYECILDNLIETQDEVHQRLIQNAIAYLVRNYGQISNGKKSDELDYNKFVNCLGYLHRYAACHTALVHTVMLKLFHINPPAVIRRMLSLKDSLKIVCLGSGPGNDLVGLLSALYGRHYGLLNIDVAVVDKMSGWSRIFSEMKSHLREGLCGNASKTYRESGVNASFMQADMMEHSSWSGAFKDKLNNADIVTLVKFLSHITSGNDKLTILKNTVLSMKPGSVLILVDCPFPEREFKALENYLDTVYEATRDKFDFNFEVTRFGYPNIIYSSAVIKVFVRKFIVATSLS